MELLEFKNVNKSYGNTEVLKNVNFKIGKNKIIGLLGKNGAGKTTIIKLINDLLTPTSGEVLINGKRPGVESKKIISYLPERTYLDKTMTVDKALKMFEDLYKDFDITKAHRLLKQLELDEKQKISFMSKGMQEKLQLVLTMSRKAQLYIFDEPLGGVDPATREYILNTILSNFEEDSTALISTHLISDVEKILDEVIFLDKGKILLQDSTDNLRDEKNMSIDEIFRREFKC